MSGHCEDETLTVHVSGEAGEGYVAMLATALQKAGDRLAPASVHRHSSDCGGVGGLGLGTDEEWYLGCGHADLPAAGTTCLTGTFTFVRWNR